MNEYEKKINNLLSVIVVIFLIGTLIYSFYSSYQLHRHFAFTVGTVTEITGPGYKSYGDYSVLYEYTVNGKTYRDNINYKFCYGQDRAQIKELLVGKRFPVAYGTNEAIVGGILLITKEQANKFKYTLPDSVRYYDSVLSCNDE